MKIIVFMLNFNNADVLPFTLRHYGSFADEISVFDDKSDDGSREILRNHPKVVLRDWPYDTGIDEDLFLKFAYEWYPRAAQLFDWAMWVDPDEIIWSKDVRQTLEDNKDYDVIQTIGFNMVGDGFPKDDGKSQIYDINPYGVVSSVYSKPVVFRPTAHVRWNRGKHALEECGGKVSPPYQFRLLHYRYMGKEYTAQKNAKNYARCGLTTGDKGAAWSCAPEYTGMHSPQWAESVKDEKSNVLLLE